MARRVVFETPNRDLENADVGRWYDAAVLGRLVAAEGADAKVARVREAADVTNFF